MWAQQNLVLRPRERGIHLVTDEIEQQLDLLGEVNAGLLHLFLQHTSAALSLNENADPLVRHDMHQYIERLVPEREPYYRHTYEGDDDMPAHIKSSLMGVSLTVPVTAGRLALGTWQGIYLAEFRNHGGSRRILATLNGG